MKTWLCIGDEKRNIPKCMHSKIKIIEDFTLRGKRITRLRIECHHYSTKNTVYKVISKFITSCDNYDNQTIEGFIK